MQEIVEERVCASGNTVQLWSRDSPGETKALCCPDAEIPLKTQTIGSVHHKLHHSIL